jgi:8-oxo-dGTP diphosphatase
MRRPRSDDKALPAGPFLSVSADLFPQGRALIIRRAQAPRIGPFSVSSGNVEVGETLTALARELMEAGIEADIVGFRRGVEAIDREGDPIHTYFVTDSFAARSVSGEFRLSDEVDAVDWIDPADPLPAPTTPEFGDVLARAARIEGRRW